MRYAGFVRGINVGGAHVVRMADLRSLLENAGLRDVQTVLQSGNFVCTGGGSGAEARLAWDAGARFGFEPDFFLIEANAFREIINGNPFATQARDDPKHVLLVLSKDTLDVEALASACGSGEKASGAGTSAYLYLPNGVATSVLMKSKEWRVAAKTSTVRNWATVTKIRDLL